MKTNDTGSNVFLTGIVLLANFDFTGLMDYGLKAVVGGAVWLAFKLTADHLADKKKQKEANQPKTNN
jgi:hypothetical protein